MWPQVQHQITRVLAIDTCSRQTAQDALGSSLPTTLITVPCALGLQLPHLSARPLVYTEASLPSCVQRGQCGCSSLVSHLLIPPLSCSSSASQPHASVPPFSRQQVVPLGQHHGSFGAHVLPSSAFGLSCFSSPCLSFADLTMISPCEERN